MEAGEIFRVPYPFYQAECSYADEDGFATSTTWSPGVQPVQVGPDGFEHYADAMGEMVLTVVSAHKPGRFPTRVFYTRQWVDPDGRTFGKGGCKIATAEKFNRLARGYRFPFTVEPFRAQPAAAE